MKNDKRMNKISVGYTVMLSVLTVALVGLSALGSSYAYWRLVKIQDNSNNATSGCFSVELINQSGEINLTNAYPLTDEQGAKLTPFTFTIHNNCTIAAHYYVNLESLEGTTLASKWVATKVNEDAKKTLDTFPSTTTSISGSIESHTISEGTVSADQSVSYSVSFWMDESATTEDDVMGKIFKSKIIVVSEPTKDSTDTTDTTEANDQETN